MKSTLVWFVLAGAVLLFGSSVDAWNRQFFNRYSRNLFRNGGGEVNAANAINGNNEIDDFNALFGLAGNEAVGGRGNNMGGGIGQQTEVYGIVEPLIEDMPCVDRPCNVNDDCCPTGVCVNTYGEGKCIYVYGRKRDLCHRNADCEPGMSCVKGVAGNMVCQAATPLHLGVLGVNVGAKALDLKQFGEDCVSSSDCNVAKGMCCQLQRSHHRIMPKKICAYFRDPFMCIEVMPTEDEEIRESRFLTSFNQRRM